MLHFDVALGTLISKDLNSCEKECTWGSTLRDIYWDDKSEWWVFNKAWWVL